VNDTQAMTRTQEYRECCLGW